MAGGTGVLGLGCGWGWVREASWGGCVLARGETQGAAVSARLDRLDRSVPRSSRRSVSLSHRNKTSLSSAGDRFANERLFKATRALGLPDLG